MVLKILCLKLYRNYSKTCGLARQGFSPTPKLGIMSRVSFKIQQLAKFLTFSRNSLDKSRRHKNTMPSLVSGFSSTPKNFGVSLLRERGFSLVEFMITISIISVLASVILINSNILSDRISINTQAYEIALIVRQSQVYALGVREFQNGGSDSFNIGYGVYFSMGATDSFVFFVDKDKDGEYDPGDGELIETHYLKEGNVISAICATLPNGNEICTENANGPFTLNVSFLRPSPSTSVKLFNPGGVQVASQSAPARVIIQSPKGTEQNILINYTGQISIE